MFASFNRPDCRGGRLDVGILMRAVFVLAALACATPVAAQNAVLAEAMKPARAQVLSQGASSFSEVSVKTGLPGKKFKLEAKFQDDLTLASYENIGRAGFLYRQGKLKLLLVGISVSDSRQAKYNVIEVDGWNLAGEPYQGSNAYGASTQVKVIGIYRNGVATLSAPTATYDTYSWESALSTSEAKAIALDAYAVIEGEYVALTDVTDADCDGWRRKPKINDPVDVLFQTCFIGANVSRVAFVRRSTGEVIQEWMK